jgi:hypothetical protein
MARTEATVALISKFVHVQKESNSVHDPVECGWTVFERNGATYVQLDTYGSGSRQIPGKVSQSIQVDEEAAGQLVRILRRGFPGL